MSEINWSWHNGSGEDYIFTTFTIISPWRMAWPYIWKKQLVIPFTHRKLCNQFAWINTVVLERKNFNGQKCILIFSLLKSSFFEYTHRKISLLYQYNLHIWTLIYHKPPAIWSTHIYVNIHRLIELLHLCYCSFHTPVLLALACGVGLWETGDFTLFTVWYV